jgi:hypothetical protein
MAHEESHQTPTSKEETSRKSFYDMKKKMKIYLKKEIQGCKVKDPILQEVMNIVLIKIQKEMEGMVVLHLHHLHLSLLLPFNNHLKILQNSMVKFLHKLLFLSLILSLNCLCTMER